MALLVRVTVPTEDCPPMTEVGLIANEAPTIAMVTAVETPFEVAVIVAVLDDVTIAVGAENTRTVSLCGTTTVVGTRIAVLLSATDIGIPLAGERESKVSLNEARPPPIKVVSMGTKLETNGGSMSNGAISSTLKFPSSLWIMDLVSSRTGAVNTVNSELWDSPGWTVTVLGETKVAVELSNMGSV